MLASRRSSGGTTRMFRSLMRLGIATLLLSAMSLPAWADAALHELGEDDVVVVPGGWELEEALDGLWIYPDGVAGYSESAQVLLVDDFYNMPFDDPKAQVATIFGYLTSGYEIVERQPALEEVPIDDSGYVYYSIDGYRAKSDSSPRLHVVAILIQNAAGEQKGYFVEAKTDEESLDLFMLIGMLNRSRDFTPDEVDNIDLETYSFTHSADYPEAGE